METVINILIIESSVIAATTFIEGITDVIQIMLLASTLLRTIGEDRAKPSRTFTGRNEGGYGLL